MVKKQNRTFRKHYRCPWCQEEFDESVSYTAYEISTKVFCHKCNRNIPTWKTESTGSSTGREHIHIR